MKLTTENSLKLHARKCVLRMVFRGMHPLTVAVKTDDKCAKAKTPKAIAILNAMYHYAKDMS